MQLEGAGMLTLQPRLSEQLPRVGTTVLKRFPEKVRLHPGDCRYKHQKSFDGNIFVDHFQMDLDLITEYIPEK